jgi:hypothetical protein
MISDLKLVYFERFCPECKYAKLAETEEPCDECLAQPVNTDSHKPVNYKPKD